MSTTMADSLVLSAAEKTLTAPPPPPVVVEKVACATCDCCGLTEECTTAYIERIRELYQGKWICGLCAEAVKDEVMRCSTTTQRLISSEEALSRHLSFCKTFQSSSPPLNPTLHLITAMRQLLRRSFDSPTNKLMMRSMPCSPTKTAAELQPIALARSGSCIPSLSLVDEGSDL